MAGLTQLVKVAVRPRDLPEFFWCHLESDMELLGSVTGKSIDDSAIIVHLVLKEILSRKPPMCEDIHFSCRNAIPFGESTCYTSLFSLTS